MRYSPKLRKLLREEAAARAQADRERQERNQRAREQRQARMREELERRATAPPRQSARIAGQPPPLPERGPPNDGHARRWNPPVREPTPEAQPQPTITPTPPNISRVNLRPRPSPPVQPVVPEEQHSVQTQEPSQSEQVAMEGAQDTWCQELVQDGAEVQAMMREALEGVSEETIYNVAMDYKELPKKLGLYIKRQSELADDYLTYPSHYLYDKNLIITDQEGENIVEQGEYIEGRDNFIVPINYFIQSRAVEAAKAREISSIATILAKSYPSIPRTHAKLPPVDQRLNHRTRFNYTTDPAQPDQGEDAGLYNVQIRVDQM